MPEPAAPLDFACPRCASPVLEQYYGPCTSCREELGASVAIDARSAEIGRYVPKMNVVPNQVASRE